MTPPLFLLADIPPGDELFVAGDEGYHAARVRRIGVDERVFVADGRGLLLDCAVTSVRSDGLVLHVLARDLVPEPQPRLIVVQALPKGERAELAVEVLTELGADEIVARIEQLARTATRQGPQVLIHDRPAIGTAFALAGLVLVAASPRLRRLVR